MKKFLSLVLALVMTMSLVTVGAGATEYKDLTDKGEIQYEEAVAVLNKLGIITGYTDGSFQPAGALTRGAAAKIIVSLMIGPEAANALTVTAAPYKDVAVDNTFAAVISYCKTAKYINGYSDGTFRPTAPLTGYAFSKMLLGALGYDGAVEKFTGEGWTMNVARLGNTAGLFNTIVDFKGNDGVNREQACQLALNTLKATMVEYTANGNNLTVGEDGKINGASTNYNRSYVVSNNETINHNINKSQSGNNANYLTLEFGEQHFQDLVLDNVKYNNDYEDDYGRPANRWSVKNVVVGTYAKTANYTFTEGASGDTSTDKVKSMGLNSYDINSATMLTVNGESRDSELTAGKTTLAANAKTLTNYVKNGSLVEVYLDQDDANIISHIAVTQTQIMQVNRVTNGDVTLKKVEDRGVSTSGAAVAVNPVEDDDALYNTLKDLKADDYVVVTPLKSGNTWDVDGIFVPTTATGKITKVKVNAKNDNTSGLTVADTDYKFSRNWTAEDAGAADPYTVLNGTSVSTKQDSTIFIDAYGFMIFAKDVKASTSYFMFDEYYANVVNGKIHYIAEGWDTKGNAVSLDMGTNSLDVSGLKAGDVMAYKPATSNSNADYEIDATKTASNVKTGTLAAGSAWDAAKISVIPTDGNTYYYKSDVKYIFTTWADTLKKDVDTVTVKDGAQKVTGITGGTKYSVVLNDDVVGGPKVTAIFIKDDSDVEVSQNVLYVEKQTALTKDADGKDVSIFTGYIDGVKNADLTANRTVADNTFYTYKVDEATGVYTMNPYAQTAGKTTSVVTGKALNRTSITNKAYIVGGTISGISIDTNIANATVVDLRTGGTISSASDMCADNAPDTYTVSLMYNGAANSSLLGRVSYIYITNSSNTVPAPVIVNDNVSGTEVLPVGGAATELFVTATGTGALSYLWQKSTNGGGTWSAAGGTAAAYTPDTTAAGTTQYRCVVKNTVDGRTNYTTTNSVRTVTVSTGAPLPVDVSVTATGYALTVTIGYNYVGTQPTAAEAAAFAKTWVDWTTGGNSVVTVAAGVYTFTVTNAAGIPVTYTFDSNPTGHFVMYVKVDGAWRPVYVGTAVSDLNTAGEEASYTKADGAVGSVVADSDSRLLVFKGEYTTGYHKVTVTAGSVDSNTDVKFDLAGAAAVFVKKADTVTATVTATAKTTATPSAAASVADVNATSATSVSVPVLNGADNLAGNVTLGANGVFGVAATGAQTTGAQNTYTLTFSNFDVADVEIAFA